MNMESKEKNNKKKKNKKRAFTIKSLIEVSGYSIAGLKHFYRYERSAIIHLIAAVLLICGSLSLNLTPIEWLFVIFILCTILSVELLNTAIEAVCDLVSPEYNPLVKIAKDCASAATFALSFALCCTFVVIYVPKILRLFGIS